MAARWSDEVFDTYREDRNGTLLEVIRSESGSGRTLVDFGCGIGTAIPSFASAFGEVIGLDRAVACVRKARAATAHLGNVRIDHTSPSTLRRLNERADVTLAVQVAIDPRRRARAAVFSKALSLTKKGGTVVFVVPSLESLVLVDALRRALGRKWRLPFSFPVAKRLTEPGVVTLGGEPTKHFVGEELVAVFRMLGCETIDLRRVAFSWSIYGVRPPDAVGTVTPWDWLVVARRRARKVARRATPISSRRSSGT
jgi:SAM-dependent methyltransferase